MKKRKTKFTGEIKPMVSERNEGISGKTLISKMRSEKPVQNRESSMLILDFLML